MTKHLILGSLSLALISILISPVKAQETIPETTSENPTVLAYETKPFNLVYLAYQGFFEDQGIEGGGSFLYDIQFGRIDAEQLIQVGIDQKRLSSSRLNDQEYISAVEDELERLITRHY